MTDASEGMLEVARAMTPGDSPLTLADVIASPLYRDLSAPELAVGDPAFDFPVTDAGVRLTDHFGKRPVALVFGSYT
jgi:hypothetical protein